MEKTETCREHQHQNSINFNSNNKHIPVQWFVSNISWRLISEKCRMWRIWSSSSDLSQYFHAHTLLTLLMCANFPVEVLAHMLKVSECWLPTKPRLMGADRRGWHMPKAEFSVCLSFSSSSLWVSDSIWLYFSTPPAPTPTQYLYFSSAQLLPLMISFLSVFHSFLKSGSVFYHQWVSGSCGGDV